jgi:predicted cation transporter
VRDDETVAVFVAVAVDEVFNERPGVVDNVGYTVAEVVAKMFELIGVAEEMRLVAAAAVPELTEDVGRGVLVEVVVATGFEATIGG